MQVVELGIENREMVTTSLAHRVTQMRTSRVTQVTAITLEG
jgi:hypothetical protein